MMTLHIETSIHSVLTLLYLTKFDTTLIVTTIMTTEGLLKVYFLNCI